MGESSHFPFPDSKPTGELSSFQSQIRNHPHKGYVFIFYLSNKIKLRKYRHLCSLRHELHKTASFWGPKSKESNQVLSYQNSQLSNNLKNINVRKCQRWGCYCLKAAYLDTLAMNVMYQSYKHRKVALWAGLRMVVFHPIPSAYVRYLKVTLGHTDYLFL